MDEVTQLKERVAELEKELDSIMYSVSHDLRAPLRAVQGFAQALSEDYGDKLEGDALKYLNVIDSGSKQMTAMIDALLNLSRFNRQEFTASTLNMNEIVAGVVLEIKAKLRNTNVEFIVSDLPPISADLSLIRQVWTSLLTNAVKFSATQSAPRVEVGAKTEPGKNIYFVRDNGIGFDMNYAKRLFWMFQRLHNDPAFDGVGSGLAIVRLLVRRHNGKVWAEAKPNAGATFYFCLPT